LPSDWLRCSWLRADDHPVVWLPAIAFGATAATSLATFYAPTLIRA